MTNNQYIIQPGARRGRGMGGLNSAFSVGQTVLCHTIGLRPDGDGEVRIYNLTEADGGYIDPQYLRPVGEAAPASGWVSANGQTMMPVETRVRYSQTGLRPERRGKEGSTRSLPRTSIDGTYHVAVNWDDGDTMYDFPQLANLEVQGDAPASAGAETWVPVTRQNVVVGETVRYRMSGTNASVVGGHTATVRSIDPYSDCVNVTTWSNGSDRHTNPRFSNIEVRKGAPAAQAFVPVREAFVEGNKLEFTVPVQRQTTNAGLYNVGCKQFSLNDVEAQLVKLDRISDTEFTMRFKGEVVRGDRKTLNVGPVSINEIEAREFFQDVAVTETAKPLIDVNLKLTQEQLNALTRLAGSGNGFGDQAYRLSDVYTALRVVGGNTTGLTVVDQNGTRMNILNVTKRS